MLLYYTPHKIEGHLLKKLIAVKKTLSNNHENVESVLTQSRKILNQFFGVRNLESGSDTIRYIDFSEKNPPITDCALVFTP